MLKRAKHQAAAEVADLPDVTEAEHVLGVGTPPVDVVVVQPRHSLAAHAEDGQRLVDRQLTAAPDLVMQRAIGVLACDPGHRLLWWLWPADSQHLHDV